MTVLDFGCGPGFFSIPAAKRVGASGKVIAADLQEDMLKRLREKIAGTELERRIILHRTGRDETLLTESVDLFWLSTWFTRSLTRKSCLRSGGPF